MIRKLFTWFFTKVIGWPQPKEANIRPYFVAVREGRSLSRVEELPSGRRVFYVDVTDIPSNRVESYLKRCKEELASDGLLVADESQ